MRGYRELADELRQRIDGGEFAAGTTLPRIVDLMDEHNLSRQTVREAIGVLADEGLVATMGKGGTLVRNRTRVHVPLNRYSQVLRPGGTKGPWETACADQGLDGRMKVVHISRGPGPEDIASLLGVPAGADLVQRSRHAMIGSDDIVQVQHAWYSADLADAAGISGTGKIEGGIFRALASAGHSPASASEQVTARAPSLAEAAQLKIGGKVSVLAIERITKDSNGRVLEVLRVVAPADRIRLTYDDLPLVEGTP